MHEPFATGHDPLYRAGWLHACYRLIVMYHNPLLGMIISLPPCAERFIQVIAVTTTYIHVHSYVRKCTFGRKLGFQSLSDVRWYSAPYYFLCHKQ